jgi:hypothetical protein
MILDIANLLRPFLDAMCNGKSRLAHRRMSRGCANAKTLWIGKGR